MTARLLAGGRKIHHQRAMTDDEAPEESEDLSKQTALFFIDRAKETLARAHAPDHKGRPA